MRASLVTLVLWAAKAYGQTPTNSTSSCTPSNCPVVCEPSCSDGTTCVLGTMRACGVCPSSTCISNSVLGIPSSSASSGNQGPDASMIGGLVGGLVGGAILLITAIYFLFRYQRGKKRNLPTFMARTNKSGHSFIPSVHTTASTTFSKTQIQEMVSGIPGYRMSAAPMPSSLSQQVFPAEPATFKPDARFSTASQLPDPPAIVHQRDSKAEIVEIDDDDDRSSVSSVSQRGSAVLTNVGQMQQAQRSAQAFQLTRVRPQIMRVNTIRQNEAEQSSPTTPLQRSGSVRTILTRDNSIKSTLSRSNTMPSRQQAPHHMDRIELSDPASPDPVHQPQRHSVMAISTQKSMDFSTASSTLGSEGTIPSKTGDSPTSSDPFHDRHSIVQQNHQQLQNHPPPPPNDQ
ncbi:hypothetical protein BC940DRAFT_369321 [Gongronella butleri]|nr:hypothetical protein BC940DRAFT_369321 [Gongronella butleri]